MDLSSCRGRAGLPLASHRSPFRAAASHIDAANATVDSDLLDRAVEIVRPSHLKLRGATLRQGREEDGHERRASLHETHFARSTSRRKARGIPMGHTRASRDTPSCALASAQIVRRTLPGRRAYSELRTPQRQRALGHRRTLWRAPESVTQLDGGGRVRTMVREPRVFLCGPTFFLLRLPQFLEQVVVRPLQMGNSGFRRIRD